MVGRGKTTIKRLNSANDYKIPHKPQKNITVKKEFINISGIIKHHG